ncbi:hypothetical protein DL766_000822 [Monosporascus sp. MC13-8B]|uniref:Cytochrome P450 n=1 Tax=Monosporascus cannonballus TaxID=155416 RepID=A0ABY0HHD9_9PEZI|nr:hypothetical protein DL762_001131 [Monosporascus cannonballus]RYO98408.1 hypothetical protein DL763_002247 [Monosporascus cannonballus]RYP38822.1 hypothetical protein DL766_000822 [Monosporascus sp. MC13-8B]
MGRVFQRTPTSKLRVLLYYETLLSIQIPSRGQNRQYNRALYTPSNLFEPQKFDPYRFYKLRTTDMPDPIGYKTREQYQFVSVTKESMGFGLGRHACPGRFFAANEIKLILARILLEYDIKMPDGIETPYSNISVGVTNGIDPTKKILLRKIRTPR